VNEIIWKQLNWFCCKLTQVVYRARTWNDLFWGSGGQGSGSHDAKVRFGGLAEASFSSRFSSRVLCQFFLSWMEQMIPVISVPVGMGDWVGLVALLSVHTAEDCYTSVTMESFVIIFMHPQAGTWTTCRSLDMTMQKATVNWRANHLDIIPFSKPSCTGYL